MRTIISMSCIMVAVLALVACERSASTSDEPQPTPTPVVMVVTATSDPNAATPTPVVMVVTATPVPQVAAEPTIPPTPTVPLTPTATMTPTMPPTATPTPLPPTATPTPTMPPDAGLVTHGGNMRLAPGSETVVGQVCPDDQFQFTMVQGEWYQIRITQTSVDCVPERVQVGNTGWVHMSLLSAPQVAVVTATPLPTPTPTPTPDVIPINQSQRIGPIRNADREEVFSTEITVKSIKWASQSGYSQPKPGNVFLLVHLRVTNLGPDTQRSVYTSDFEIMTGSGSILGDRLFLDLADDCRLDLVDLVAGGSVEGCVAYEVPDTGKISLIFAPYQYDGYGAGRYLAFPLR